MPDLHLVAIGRDGTPSEPVEALPETARKICAGMRAFYGKIGFVPPWIGYLALDGVTCVGTCSFKAPVQENRVEIAYFTFPEHEGRGYATRMAQALVALAVEAQPGVLVTAQTLPAEGASTSLLKKLGFQRAADVQHPEDGLVWEWHYPASGQSAGANK
jgi:RimJ/RimL family protein N-acetyltransferase